MPTTLYAQRGGFHVIEHQLAAALELFPYGPSPVRRC